MQTMKHMINHFPAYLIGIDGKMYSPEEYWAKTFKPDIAGFRKPPRSIRKRLIKAGLNK